MEILDTLKNWADRELSLIDKDFKTININEDNSKEYIMKQSSNNKNTLLKSYDLFLSNKYNVTLNQKTIERVKNFFK